MFLRTLRVLAIDAQIASLYYVPADYLIVIFRS